MAFGGGGGKGVKGDINVTPLVDVVLVLLIIFMVVTPMLQRGKDVKLPQSHSIDEEKKDSDPLVISVTKTRTVWLESDQLTEATLETRIADELRKTPGRQLLLKGDEALTVSDVRKVMQRLRTAGAKGVALGVEELKGGKK